MSKHYGGEKEAAPAITIENSIQIIYYCAFNPEEEMPIC